MVFPGAGTPEKPHRCEPWCIVASWQGQPGVRGCAAASRGRERCRPAVHADLGCSLHVPCTHRCLRQPRDRAPASRSPPGAVLPWDTWTQTWLCDGNVMWGQHLLQDRCPVCSQHAHTDLPFLPSFLLPFLLPLAAGESNIYRKPPIYKRHGRVCWLHAGLCAAGSRAGTSVGLGLAKSHSGTGDGSRRQGDMLGCCTLLG